MIINNTQTTATIILNQEDRDTFRVKYVKISTGDDSIDGSIIKLELVHDSGMSHTAIITTGHEEYYEKFAVLLQYSKSYPYNRPDDIILSYDYAYLYNMNEVNHILSMLTKLSVALLNYDIEDDIIKRRLGIITKGCLCNTNLHEVASRLALLYIAIRFKYPEQDKYLNVSIDNIILEYNDYTLEIEPCILKHNTEIDVASEETVHTIVMDDPNIITGASGDCYDRDFLARPTTITIGIDSVSDDIDIDKLSIDRFDIHLPDYAGRDLLENGFVSLYLPAIKIAIENHI